MVLGKCSQKAAAIVNEIMHLTLLGTEEVSGSESAGPIPSSFLSFPLNIAALPCSPLCVGMRRNKGELKVQKRRGRGEGRWSSLVWWLSTV